MVQTKAVEKIKTRVLYSIMLFSKNRFVHEIMCKTMIDPDRPRLTIWRMPIACCITKSADTHSECVILIASQRWQ